MTRLGYATAFLLFVAWSLACMALGAQVAMSAWIERTAP